VIIDIIHLLSQILVILLIMLLTNYCTMEKNKSMYYLYHSHCEFGETYLSVITSDSWLRHRRLGHISMDSIIKFITLYLVRGLSPKRYELERLCNACMQSKQARSSFKLKKWYLLSFHYNYFT
jgi:GAG-pre-integrase domain